MNVLIGTAMKSTGIIRFRNGLFTYLANKFTVLIDSKISVQKEFNIRDDNDYEIYSLYPRQSCHQGEK